MSRQPPPPISWESARLAANQPTTLRGAVRDVLREALGRKERQ